MKANFEKFGNAAGENVDYNDKLDDSMLAGEESVGRYRLLPKGEYPFRVEEINYEQSKSGKNMIKATIAVQPEGESEVWVTDFILLTTTTMWKVAQFFASIGMFEYCKEHGMDWDKTIDKEGRILLGHRMYDGKERNEIVRYIVPSAPAVK